MASPDTAATAPDAPAARSLALYESAMCCPTGVCGPSVDQQVIDVREHLRWAEGEGARVARHNLASDPAAFVANAKVTGLMTAFGEDALPVLVLDGEIAMHGRYPTRADLANLLGTEPATAEPSRSGGCGCGPSGC